MKLSYTEQEMLETEKVCLDFDFGITEQLSHKIGTDRIIFTGMGSSLIFPGKQAKNRAMKLNPSNRIESYFASDLFQYTDFKDTYVFLCSNSGKTKEVILLLDHVKSLGAKCVAVTAVEDSILADRSDEKIILSCGFEQGVAATKSVVEQGLIYDSLIHHLSNNQGAKVNFSSLKEELTKTALAIRNNVNVTLDKDTLATLVESNNYFMVGLDNGVAEEITLKSYEIARKMALFYPDTHIVHGVEEAIEGNCAVIFRPSAFKEYLSDFQTFSDKTNCQLIGIDNQGSLIGVGVDINETFSNYCLLAAGWGLLRSVGNELQLDIDHPEKASKVGNPYSE